jgi:hypothetical protein
MGAPSIDSMLVKTSGPIIQGKGVRINTLAQAAARASTNVKTVREK